MSSHSSTKAPSGPALPPLSAAATRDRLAGHAGHLTAHQAEALEKFKTKLAADEYFNHGNGNEDASHDDATLLRFLRARKFDVNAAYAQFTSAENWRRRENVDATYDEFDVVEFTESQKVYPQWTGRRDKSGLPVYVFKISGLTKEVIGKYNSKPERLQPRMVALYEHMVQFALPFCSDVPRSHEETPISATVTIVDISGVSLARFWALRPHMQRASTLATANYAETLGMIFLVGAPNFFSVVWGWIGRWFDPGTVEKIFILKDHEVLPTLSRFIDKADIPKLFGGDLDWSYNGGTGPSLDQPMRETLGLEKLPEGPIRWIKRKVVLKGTGRLQTAGVETAVKEDSVTRMNGNAPSAADTAVAKDSTLEHSEEPSDSVPVSAVEPEVVAAGVEAPHASGQEVIDKMVNDAVEGEAKHEAREHNIWVAAREEPAAPVKELAAALEGTQL